VDEPDLASPFEHLFSRDCAQYEVQVGSSGATVWVLLNHFKSQSGGGGPKRMRQAQGVRTIVDSLVAAGETIIVVMGDLNEGPAAVGQSAANLAPLYGPTSPLVDVYTLPAFDVGSRPGSFQGCAIRNRLDYIFVSQALANLVTFGGVERRGLWGTPTHVNPPTGWGIYGDIEGVSDSASDHAAIFVDVNV
jgi:endonuclease/exonuclease/phosphatase family metal-dependent hydrolase